MADEGRSPVGELLRTWRHARGLSQMELAHRAGISPRHMSFVETGRSRPGREVLLDLSDVLGVPFRERNQLLEAAGYARVYRDSALDDEAVARVADVLRFLLRSHEPYSAVVVDSEWNVRMANDPHRHFMARLLADAPEEVREEENILVQTFHPRGLRPRIRNFGQVAHSLLERLEAQARSNPMRDAYGDLLERLRGLGDLPDPPPAPGEGPLPILLPVELEVEGRVLRLFTTLTTLGTPQDALLQELRIETFFPADEETEAAVRELAG